MVIRSARAAFMGFLVAVGTFPTPLASAQSPLSSAPPILSPGGVEGRVAAVAEEDLIPMPLTGTSLLTLSVTPLDPLLDPVVDLLAPDGAWLATDDDVWEGELGGSIRAMVDRPGTYMARVRSAGQGSTGRYRVEVSVTPVHPLVSEGPTSGTLEQNGVALFSVDPRDEPLLIRLTSQSAPPYVSALDPVTMQEIGLEQMLLGSETAYRARGLAHPFLLHVASLDGEASFSITAGPDEVELGRTELDIDTQGAALPTFLFPAEPGSLVEVWAESGDFEPRLTIDGEPETRAGDGYRASTMVIPTEDLVRFSVVTSGACCHLRVGAARRTLSSYGTPIEPGDRVSGNLTDDEDLYVFVGHAGDYASIRMRSDQIDSYLELEDAAGRELSFDDDGGPDYDASIDLPLDTTGIYVIRARSSQGGEGAYTLDLSLD